jgi:hypothetical protein
MPQQNDDYIERIADALESIERVLGGDEGSDMQSALWVLGGQVRMLALVQTYQLEIALKPNMAPERKKEILDQVQKAWAEIAEDDDAEEGPEEAS